MLVYSEVTGKSITRLAIDCFWVSPILPQKSIFYTDLLPNPLVKQNILLHKIYFKSLGWLKFPMVYQKIVQPGCQLGL